MNTELDDLEYQMTELKEQLKYLRAITPKKEVTEGIVYRLKEFDDKWSKRETYEALSAIFASKLTLLEAI